MSIHLLASHGRGCHQSALRLISLITCVAIIFCETSYAANSSAGSQLGSGNNDVCSIFLPDDVEWTPTETWTWDRLCRGLTADLSKYNQEPSVYKYNKEDCDPKTVNTWPERRRLSGDYISTIISSSPYMEIIARQGLSLRCASVEDDIDYLGDDRFEHSIRIADSYIAGSVDFLGAFIEGRIKLDNTVIIGDVVLGGIKGVESIWINDTTITGELYAVEISSEGGLSLKKSRVKSVDLSYSNLGSASIIDVHINGDIDLDNVKSGSYVSIKDAIIAGDLYAMNITVGDDFFLSGQIAASVDLSAARIGGDLIVSGVGLESSLEGKSMAIQGDLNIENVTGIKTNAPLLDISDVESYKYDSGTWLNLSGGVVHGSLNINKISMGGLVIENMDIARAFKLQSSDINLAVFDNISIRNMYRITDSSLDVFVVFGGQFNHFIIDNLCTNELVLLTAEVNGTMLIGGTVFGDLSITMSEFGGNVRLESVVGGDLLFSSVSTDANLFLAGEFLQDIKLDLTRVDGSVLLTEGRFLGRVDLRGIEVGHGLVLAAADQGLPDWGDSVELSLRDARIGNLQHVAANWQDLGGRYGITGLQYERLIFEDGDMPGQEPAWVLNWLKDQKARDTTFNPQPYTELAKALHRSGFTGLSNEVSITARDHELASPETSRARKINLFLQKYIIGYGYQSWRAFGWLALLIVIGTYVAGKTCWGRRAGYVRRLFFSLDMLLPQMAQLDKRHDDLKLGGSFVWCPKLPVGVGRQRKTVGPLTMPVQYYFFLHKLVGSILMLFAIAGLSGLTK